jgi:hypothetical protein
VSVRPGFPPAQASESFAFRAGQPTDLRQWLLVRPALAMRQRVVRQQGAQSPDCARYLMAFGNDLIERRYQPGPIVVIDDPRGQQLDEVDAVACNLGQDSMFAAGALVDLGTVTLQVLGVADGFGCSGLPLACLWPSSTSPAANAASPSSSARARAAGSCDAA